MVVVSGSVMSGTQGIELTELIQTGAESPSQWNAWTRDGQYLYIRYRSGWLTVRAAATKEDWRSGPTWILYDEQLSPNKLDGVMDTATMLKTTGLIPP